MSSALALMAGLLLLSVQLSRVIAMAQRQTTAALRQLQAFEAAEAGLEWVLGRLNDPRGIDERCEPGTADNFRNRYLPYVVQTNPLLGAYAPKSLKVACALLGSEGMPALSCSCPSSGEPQPLGAGADTPVFSLSFQALSSSNLPGGTLHGEAVLVTSLGCSSADVRCLTGQAAGGAEGFQKTSMIVKLLPALLSQPASTITAGGSVDTRAAPGSRSVNTDVASQGIVLDTGGTLTGSLEKVTLAGKTPEQSVVSNDAPLAQLAQGGTLEPLLQAYFGTGFAQLKSHPSTRVLGTAECGSDCSSALRQAYAEGWRVFALEAPINLTGSTASLGSASDPVTLVSTARVVISTSVAVYGLVVADDFNWSAAAIGGSSVGVLQGALITRQAFTPTADASYTYNPALLTLARGRGGSLLRVPGSWKDS